MKLRLLVLTLALALTSIAAHAQIGLYLNPVVSRIGISTPDTAPFAFLGADTTSRIFGGVDFGGYYDFAHFSKASAGLDLRDIIQHGNAASLNSFLAGLHVEAKPLAHSLKPYAQLSVGEARTKSPLSPIHIGKLEYSVFAGVDRPIAKHVDWRIVEIGYGSATTISSNSFGTVTAVPIAPAKLLDFSAGLVFRIP